MRDRQWGICECLDLGCLFTYLKSYIRNLIIEQSSAVLSAILHNLRADSFWTPATGGFIESAHARWLDEDDVAGAVPNTPTEPIQDPPSDINKLLNSVNTEEFVSLVEVLQTLKLNDLTITEKIREQDRASENVRALAAGIAHKLPRLYKLAMKSSESDSCNVVCDNEIEMLRKMIVWEEVALPAGKRAVSSKWVFNKKTD